VSLVESIASSNPHDIISHWEEEMSSLEIYVTVIGLLVLWQLNGIRRCLEENLAARPSGPDEGLLKVLQDIRGELCSKYQGSGSNVKLTSWGIKHTLEKIEGWEIRPALEKIQEEIGTQYRQEDGRFKVTQWGIRDILGDIKQEVEGLRSDFNAKD
jgi:hypothetical protein